MSVLTVVFIFITGYGLLNLRIVWGEAGTGLANIISISMIMLEGTLAIGSYRTSSMDS